MREDEMSESEGEEYAEIRYKDKVFKAPRATASADRNDVDIATRSGPSNWTVPIDGAEKTG